VSGKHEAVEDRPEPVLDAARVGGLTSSAVTAIIGLAFTIRQGVSTDNLASLGTAVELAVTAFMSLMVYVIPVAHARIARGQVTPVEDPRDDASRPLVPVSRPG
jgi:TRAP-type C4-dicarboxylate transport system permease large subunit